MNSIRRIVGLLSLLAVLSLSGCGTYKIEYVRSSVKPSERVTRFRYSHGFGIVGGGFYFFALHRIFPCWADYSGPVDLSRKCPGEFSRVEQYQSFGFNSLSAFISWLALVNPWHSSNVDVTQGQTKSEVAK